MEWLVHPLTFVKVNMAYTHAYDDRNVFQALQELDPIYSSNYAFYLLIHKFRSRLSF